MKSKLNRFTQGTAAGLLLGCVSFISHAEITLIKQDPQPDDLLSRLNFEVGGSIRPQFNMESGNKDKGSYKNNGFDGGTRFRFTADYYLFDDISWISYYELGVDIPAVFGWDRHHADHANDTQRRMLYTGFNSKTYGQLTFGQRNSIYYDVVGVKTDIWDYDMLGQAPGNGVNGDYDGSYRPRKQLRYQNTVGDADLYIAYLFPDSDLLTGDGLRYKRKGGGSFGVDYHIMKDLTWGFAYNYTTARVKDPEHHSSKSYDQDITGTALSWTPDNWTISAGGGWYHNFMTTKMKKENEYFAGNAYGLEYFLGYTFPIDKYAVKSVQPYFMGDRIKYVSGRNYQRHDNGFGVSTRLAYGFKVDYEHVFSTATDDGGDMNLVRVTYDF